MPLFSPAVPKPPPEATKGLHGSNKQQGGVKVLHIVDMIGDCVTLDTLQEFCQNQTRD